MGSESLEQYLAFVRDVLGVHKVMTSEDLQSQCPFSDEKGSLQEAQLLKNYDLVFINRIFTSKESLFQSKTWDLYAKMKAAMKLSGKSILEVDTKIQNKDEILKNIHAYLKTHHVVLFLPEPHEMNLKSHYNFKLIECHSPYLLLSSAQHKKTTWEALQKVMSDL